MKKLLPKDAAILARAAVAIELELMCPIRLENLAQLDFGKDFVAAAVVAMQQYICSSRVAGRRTGTTSSLSCPANPWR